MSGGTHRSEPPSPDDELARLAAEGQRRTLEARATEMAARHPVDERDRERNIRIALGGYDRGPFVRVAAIVIVVVGLASLVGVAVLDLDALVWGVPGIFVGGLVYVWAPKASRQRVSTEEAWLSSLPFLMTGYFEALGATPALGMTLVVSIAWREDGSVPDEGTLQGLLGLVDANARVESRGATTARIRSGSISGWTGIQARRGFAHRNTRLVGYVHRLVQEVLMPLDRSGRLERVTLTRE